MSIVREKELEDVLRICKKFLDSGSIKSYSEPYKILHHRPRKNEQPYYEWQADCEDNLQKEEV